MRICKRLGQRDPMLPGFLPVLRESRQHPLHEPGHVGLAGRDRKFGRHFGLRRQSAAATALSKPYGQRRRKYAGTSIAGRVSEYCPLTNIGAALLNAVQFVADNCDVHSAVPFRFVGGDR